MWPFRKSNSTADEEREKLERLVKAEGELTNLQQRATVAHRLLDERRARNHWRESIETMIQGGI